ncbi:FecCD family ABC transporter permease [Nakamurella lactea]|uniref:FecCD family ABC transporter permease n=1 Tax=Nakamurella lactea TaxID=459515 RepID=UPI0003F7E92D|nr:iron ABC transporter permease [Nakamurella lactea]
MLGFVLVVVLLVVVLLSLAVGSRNIAPSEVLSALFTGADSDDATVITSQRLPRTLLGLLVGVALGMAGALMQGHTRNPLADPGLFGVNAGASFGVALSVSLFGGVSSGGLVVAALVGAGAAAVIVFAFGLRDISGSSLMMLAVVGTTLAALLAALTTALVLLDASALDAVRFWNVGTLAQRNYDLVGLLVPLLVVGLLLALYNSISLNALGLGEQVATSLGTRVAASRMVSIVSITLLAGAATAICGPISFLGLVAPHVARAIGGSDYRRIVPFAGLTGAVLLLTADTVGRITVDNGELQVGIVLAVIGAPVLLAITRRRRLVAL